jgi:hypothetical protein
MPGRWADENMATIREYFDLDVRDFSLHSEWGMRSAAGAALQPAIAKIVQDLDGNAKHWRFYIPAADNIGAYVGAILSAPETERCVLSGTQDNVWLSWGFTGYSEAADSSTLVFTRRIFFYIDAALSVADRKEVSRRGSELGFHVLVRDQEYASRRSEMQKPMAFISHDTRDKDSLVRELVAELSKLQCPVWYDEYSLRVGDSLRASIEKGLKEAPKCILVLSPNFLVNGGWGKAEFDSIYTREILEKNNILLPVWHGVGVREVYEYSPRLADKVGLDSAMGTTKLAQKLAAAIKGGRL